MCHLIDKNKAPLFPKLRGKIAEFLNEGYLDHLGTFIPTYQSRFAVRALMFQRQRSFSWRHRMGQVTLDFSSTSPYLQL
jgi:hypothetical protein